MSEKCHIIKHNNNSGIPLTSRRTDGGENHGPFKTIVALNPRRSQVQDQSGRLWLKAIRESEAEMWGVAQRRSQDHARRQRSHPGGLGGHQQRPRGLQVLDGPFFHCHCLAMSPFSHCKLVSSTPLAPQGKLGHGARQMAVVYAVGGVMRANFAREISSIGGPYMDLSPWPFLSWAMPRGDKNTVENITHWISNDSEKWALMR